MRGTGYTYITYNAFVCMVKWRWKMWFFCTHCHQPYKTWNYSEVACSIDGPKINARKLAHEHYCSLRRVTSRTQWICRSHEIPSISKLQLVNIKVEIWFTAYCSKFDYWKVSYIVAWLQDLYVVFPSQGCWRKVRDKGGWWRIKNIVNKLLVLL